MGGKAKEDSAPVSAGVRSLMNGHKPSTPKAAFPRRYLFAGDVLLVALALATLYTSRHPLSWRRELFCAALVILAAVLAVIALLTPEGKPGGPPGKV